MASFWFLHSQLGCHSLSGCTSIRAPNHRPTWLFGLIYLWYVNCTMFSVDDMSEIKLANGPEDGVSAVKFAPNSSQFLLVSSWDTTVRLYDVNDNTMRLKYSHSAPVLDCCFQVLLLAWIFILSTLTLKTLRLPFILGFTFVVFRNCLASDFCL